MYHRRVVVVVEAVKGEVQVCSFIRRWDRTSCYWHKQSNKILTPTAVVASHSIYHTDCSTNNRPEFTRGSIDRDQVAHTHTQRLSSRSRFHAALWYESFYLSLSRFFSFFKFKLINFISAVGFLFYLWWWMYICVCVSSDVVWKTATAARHNRCPWS